MEDTSSLIESGTSRPIAKEACVKDMTGEEKVSPWRNG